jgi:hypothetical protein
VNGPRRFHDATVLSEHGTAADAFAELARLTERLQRFGIAPERFQWVVVDATPADTSTLTTHRVRPIRGH